MAFLKANRGIALLVLVWVLLSAGGSLITGLIIKSGVDAQQGKLDRAESRLDSAGKALAVQQHKLFNGQVAGCVRADIQVVKDNRSQRADWQFDGLIATSLEHPQGPQTAAQQMALAKFLPTIDAAVAAKAWVPPIKDCTATVKRHGSNFVLPQPIAFNDLKHPPPASAFRLPPPPPLSPKASGG